MPFPPQWSTVLSPHIDESRIADIEEAVRSERLKHEVFPSEELMWHALEAVSPDAVKVVIVGQDPYHCGAADGMCFSASSAARPPPSLRNILAEAGCEGRSRFGLKEWADQGVLLINRVLTVRRAAPMSHRKLGWQPITEALAKAVADLPHHVVWMLWGNQAQELLPFIDLSKHSVLSTSHPSPLAARRTATPFLGSGCFNSCNAALVAHSQEPVKWN